MHQLYNTSDIKRALDIKSKDFFSDFRRDYARVIHSASFRRLQAKTQIFPNAENDFFRNRLTHSLEVAQIAKSIAYKINKQHNLGIDLDLIEVSSICHDIGHPPFGHNGEYALHYKMRNYGGFEANAQTLRILSKLEKKYIETVNHANNGVDYGRIGLNLTYRSLASILKYDHEIPKYCKHGIEKGYYEQEKDIVLDIKKNVLSIYNPDVYSRLKFKTIECEIMDIADDIAYSTYDVEDCFKGGFLNPLSMVSADDYTLTPVLLGLKDSFPDITINEIKEILKSVFSEFINFNADAVSLYQQSNDLTKSSYLRTKFNI